MATGRASSRLDCINSMDFLTKAFPLMAALKLLLCHSLYCNRHRRVTVVANSSLKTHHVQRCMSVLEASLPRSDGDALLCRPLK